jgi:hypothetical protein
MAQMDGRAGRLQSQYEIRPDPQALTGHVDPSKNSSTGVDYTPQPECFLPPKLSSDPLLTICSRKSIKVSPAHQKIVETINALYSGCAKTRDAPEMLVYAEEAIYDDPWSFCDTRRKIAAQMMGIPIVMSSCPVTAYEILEDDENHIVYKKQQDFTPRGLGWVGGTKTVVSLVTLSLEPGSGPGDGTGSGQEWKGKVKYLKEMWNEKDYSHEGLGKAMKTLQSDLLPGLLRPDKEL